jgi:hypothetical protein
MSYDVRVLGISQQGSIRENHSSYIAEVHDWSIDQKYTRSCLYWSDVYTYIAVCIDNRFYHEAYEAQQFKYCFNRRGSLQQ